MGLHTNLGPFLILAVMKLLPQQPDGPPIQMRYKFGIYPGTGVFGIGIHYSVISI